ncbi:methionyl-tRNA formyltransferase [uncultured Limnohabitans sp.]|jgi:methionyl-tRNA formyltransferase|uniref:methionyl-tRNA formyltransferase n=1 Tax=uncultured Limnohabitans sp. TaxID=768543 RepID=UPI001B4F70B2|nr:methionyl-tRNA formyltransferase [uncultured Limnohabitans sp.]MBP6221544.1 methionyl-tRNA formyltransferase [Limnohabitans sp.]MBP6246062.1 methionyl-tRNA formyltransferase [Limnohabitans sp.]
MRLIFAGTPEFAQVAMAALHAAGHEIVLVLTQPDRPAGRGMKLQPSPVKQWALDHAVPVAQPRSLRLDGKYPEDAAAAREALLAAKVDKQAEAMVVAAYGLILPQWTLDLPPRGCLNIHASLLPRWRGAAPIHRAIEAGDTQTGITIMQMDAGLDTGDMLLVRPEAILPTDTTAVLHDRLAALGGEAIVQAVASLDALTHETQALEGVTYAHKIEKAEAALNWALNAEVLARRIRAFDPFPGMTAPLTTASGTETLKLWQAVAEPLQTLAEPGTVVQADASGVRVACGQGQLCLTQLQRPGGKRLSAADFLRGCPLQTGQRLVVA